jgi:hypothetical protein
MFGGLLRRLSFVVMAAAVVIIATTASTQAASSSETSRVDKENHDDTSHQECPPSSPLVRCAYGPPVSCWDGACTYPNQCMARSAGFSATFDIDCIILDAEN